MTLEDRDRGNGGPEQPTIGTTLNFVHRFSGGNHNLEGLMREYILQTRFEYVQMKLMDEADKRTDALAIEIAHTLIEGDRHAYESGNRQYAEKDRFRNHVVIGKTTGSPEVDELLCTDIHFLTTLGIETIDGKIRALKHAWEKNHPGQIFAPDNEVPRD